MGEDFVVLIKKIHYILKDSGTQIVEQLRHTHTHTKRKGMIAILKPKQVHTINTVAVDKCIGFKKLF